MINPDDRDIGRKVVYTGNRYPGGKLEEGVITSFNAAAVFVRYGSDAHSKATSREDLEWLRPYRKSDVKPKGPAGDRGQVGWMGGEFDR